jgi:dipeptidyl aminopeptidase/acylaminoacyl peptidase
VPPHDSYVVGTDDEENNHSEDITASKAPIEDASAVEDAAEPAAPTGPYVLVNHDGADRSPRWSPDGEIIAMTSTIDGRDVIALTTAEGGDVAAIELLTWSRSNDREPVWSRDGKFLAFLRQRPEDNEFHDIYCFSLENGELLNLTSEKAPAIRHSLEWVPGRNLIAYVTRENEWLSISVINADNKAGWTVTRESGDKTEPRFAQDEARMVYVRTEGFTTVLCERSLHASSSIALDPGEGVVRYPRWLNGKRVAYGFSAPQRPFGFMVQENTAKSDRMAITPGGQPSIVGYQLRQPQPFEFEVGPEEMFSGMLYRTQGVSGKAPGIIYLPDGPLTTRRGEFQIEEQALASSALTVLTPVIHGASGFGSAIENDLRDFAHTELETSDIVEAGRALGREESVDTNSIALVGHGFGGALALVTAGARPGVYSTIVAIDPVTDWSIELSNAEVSWRNWVTDRFGMPLTHADHYALRTPATFSAVIDVPLTLVRTARASEARKVQMDLFTEDLDELGVAYQVLEAPDEPLAATLRRVSREVARLFLDGADGADVVSDLRADDLN